MRPQSKEDLSVYCLRKLGSPVIKINIAKEQIDDRIDEALETFFEKHYDATEFGWFSYRLTKNDIESGYIQLPDDVLSVTQLLPSSSLNGYGSFGDKSFSPEYQMAFQSWGGYMPPLDQIGIFMSIQNFNQTNDMFRSEPTFGFSKHGTRLKPAQDMSTFREGDLFAAKMFKIIDPTINKDVWNDKWLKQFATALIKRQWAENMQKYSSVSLLNGDTLNAEVIYSQAQEEIARLETQLMEEYQEPVNFFIG